MRALAPLILGFLALLGCGSSDVGIATGALASSLSPDPIVEATCPPADCGALAGQLQASASLTVRETAGVGVNLDSVSMTLQSKSGGTLIASGVWTGPALVQQAGGSARVAAMGSRNVSVSLHYDQSAGGHPATFSVTVSGTDDRGHAVSASASTQVTP
ncbi:MAG TPA: hypothetical protein VFN91_09785 [Myxococcaceae bacterium]|nr:hypothetical protein [Myxococcaceae bacterium]